MKQQLTFPAGSISASASLAVSAFASFTFFAFSPLLSQAYDVGPALLLIAACLMLLISRQSVGLSRDDRRMITILVGFFAVSALLNLLHGFDGSEFDRASRFLLAAPCIVFILRYPPPVKLFWLAVGLGACLSGIYAFLQYLLVELGYPPAFYDGAYTTGGRVKSYDNPVYFGNMALILSLFCLVGLSWASCQDKAVRWIGFLCAGFALGLFASLLSGTRSGWVTLPIAVIVLGRIYGGSLKSGYFWKTLLSLIAIMVVAFAVPQAGVRDRVYAAFSDLEQYFSGTNRNTSVGYRLEMWRAGIKAFQKSPVVGLGAEGFAEFQQELISEGQVVKEIEKWRHLHNQYVEALAKQGLIGFVALICLFWVSLRLFYKAANSREITVRSVAGCGVILIIAYIDINLTQALFARNIGVMQFVFMLVFIWGLVSAEQRRTESREVSL